MSDLKEENIFYELSAFFSSNLSDKEAEEKFNNLLKQIEDFNGTVLETSLPRLEMLAYPINKETSGYFCLVKFRTDGGLIEELQKKLKLMPEILRFIILKKEETSVKIDHQKKLKTEAKRLKADKKREEFKEEREVSLEELDKKLNEILKE